MRAVDPFIILAAAHWSPSASSYVVSPCIVVEIQEIVFATKEEEVSSSAGLGPSHGALANRGGPDTKGSFHVIPIVAEAAEVVLRADVFPHVVELCGRRRKARGKGQTVTAKEPKCRVARGVGRSPSGGVFASAGGTGIKSIRRRRSRSSRPLLIGGIRAVEPCPVIVAAIDNDTGDRCGRSALVKPSDDTNSGLRVRSNQDADVVRAAVSNGGVKGEGAVAGYG